MNCSRSFLLALLALIPAANAAEAPLKPGDFAYGMELKVGNGDAFYSVTLPADVYRHVTRTDAGDLRVFNAAGESVPFSLRRPGAEVTTASAMLPLFPIYTTGGALPEGMVLRVQKDAHGRIVTVAMQDGARGTRRLAAYVLDAGGLKRAVEAIEFEWQETPKNFLGQVTVEAGDDLAHWSTVAHGASLAGLTYGEQRLEHRRVELAAVRSKYLRLSWPADQAMPAIKSVRAELAGEVTVKRIWVPLDAAEAAVKPGEYVFTAPGRLPADRARILLPESNALIRAELSTRNNARDPWRVRTSGVVYRLNLSGASFVGSDIALPPAGGERHWLLRVTPADGLGTGRPTVEFGFVPQQLVFVARGAGPFQLAYGAAGVAPAQFPLDGVLAEVGRAASGPALVPAQVGPEIALGGAGRLGDDGSGYPWKKWLLWVTLVAGVGLLAEMARRLFRQMGQGNGPAAGT
jgi:hypothetical protein